MIWIKGDLIVLNLSVDECLRKLYVGIFEPRSRYLAIFPLERNKPGKH